MRITDKRNRELADMMLKESTTEQREREETHRALPQDEQPYMVVCFGMLSYRVLWISPDGSDKSKANAEDELGWWQDKARCGGLAVLPLSRNVSEHDFQVRQQWDLDDLTRAILDSYPEREN